MRHDIIGPEKQKESTVQYLSFDIECCDGKHICEFGYVITDENFKVTKKECYTINPEKPFNLIGRENREDCILFFPEEKYYNSPIFPAFYNKIKNLVSMPETIIFGHAMRSDAIFLRDACKRYKLPSLNFDFIDSQELYKEFSGIHKYISLENAETVLDLDKPQFHHKSDDDALLTIELVEKICKELNVNVSELMILCPTACGASHNFNIQYTGDDLQSMMNALGKNSNALSQSRKQKCIQKFAETVVSEGDIIESCLNNKKLCFSRVFEKSNTADTLKLIQVLANHGCKYNVKVSENDYYVADDEELLDPIPKENTRYFAALKNDDGRNVKVISFEDFLAIIDLTTDEIKQLKMPVVPKRKTKKKKVYSTGSNSYTIGDQLRAHGIDLTKWSN